MPLPPPHGPHPGLGPTDDWGDLVGLLGPAGEAPWAPEGAAPAAIVPGAPRQPPGPASGAAPAGLGDPLGLFIPADQVVPADSHPRPVPATARVAPAASPEDPAWDAEQRRPPHPECAARAWRVVRAAWRVPEVVRAVAAYGEPESWLDVDAGDGRFAAEARRVLPYTAFDGTGLGAEVERARAAGVLDEAYRGTLPLLAGELGGRYDVVGLLHQLGDCPDPQAELAAARAVLRPGGLLLVEAPDPGCRTAALLGPWCLPHCAARPALTAEAVCELLRGLEFELVAVDRPAAHVPRTLDALRAAAGLPGARLTRAADRLLAPLLRRTGFANAFRIVARRPVGEVSP